MSDGQRIRVQLQCPALLDPDSHQGPQPASWHQRPNPGSSKPENAEIYCQRTMTDYGAILILRLEAQSWQKVISTFTSVNSGVPML